MADGRDLLAYAGAAITKKTMRPVGHTTPDSLRTQPCMPLIFLALNNKDAVEFTHDALACSTCSVP